MYHLVHLPLPSPILGFKYPYNLLYPTYKLHYYWELGTHIGTQLLTGKVVYVNLHPTYKLNQYLDSHESKWTYTYVHIYTHTYY